MLTGRLNTYNEQIDILMYYTQQRKNNIKVVITCITYDTITFVQRNHSEFQR